MQYVIWCWSIQAFLVCFKDVKYVQCIRRESRHIVDIQVRKDGKSNARDVPGRTGNIAEGTEAFVDVGIVCDEMESGVREILYRDVKPAVKLE